MATKSRKSGKTPEQRAAEAEALQASIVEQVETLTTSEGWKRFLKMTQSFHAYSLNNLLLILSQREDATQVAGFRQWQERGRQVRKGERAIKIRGFWTKKVEREDAATGETTEHVLPRFPILSVFDVSQTDPIEGAETVDNPVQMLEGDDPEGITDLVAAWLTERGWTFERGATGTTNGYTNPTDRRVVVSADLDGAAAAKTALHEAAHVVLHSELAPTDYQQHRGTAETEAESVAYVMGGLFGLDTAAYSIGYIAGWADGDLDLIKTTAENVLRGVNELTELIPTQEGSAA